MRLLILVGLPASGKSTFRETMLNRVELNNGLAEYAVISSDDEIESIGNRYGKAYNEIFKDQSLVDLAMKRADIKFRQALNNSKYIILDRTNMSVKSRAKYVKEAKAKGYGVDAMVFERPMTDAAHDDWNRRLDSRPGKTIPTHVLIDMFCNYQQPTNEEGIDNVIFHDSFGKDRQ